jgi:hypothetical protein
LPGVDAGRDRRGITDRDPLERRIGNLAHAPERARPIARDGNRKLVAKHVDARSVLQEAGGGDEVHLRFVGADKEIDRRAVDDLAGEHVGGAEVEPHAATPAPPVFLGDGGERVRQTDGGRHGNRLRRGQPLTGREPRRDMERQQRVHHAASLLRMRGFGRASPCAAKPRRSPHA